MEIAPAGRESLIAELRSFIASRLDEGMAPDAIERDKHLYDFGYLDSMRGADFLVHIEQRYGVFVPETDLVGRFSTLEAIADHILERAS